jgi:phosphate transport system substrate-binding protein
MTSKILNRSSLTIATIASIAAMTGFAGSAQAQIKADGSSTVFPITERAAAEFQKSTGKKVTVGISGTGGGFKKFCKGETDIANASRKISDKEKELCSSGNVKYVEVKIATDAITVVVNPSNPLTNISKSQLKKIWDNGSTVKNWQDADGSFPNLPIKLFGPGADSGTFDYFTEAINGKSKQSRADYTASEDDNVLVQGVSRDKSAMGYFGFAYFEKNKSRLKALNIEGVAPNLGNVKNGSYPLARPLYLYVNVDKLNSNGELKAFVETYLNGAEGFVTKAGYLPLSGNEYNDGKKAIAGAK